jgi:unsaturated rhamnogalacturonyl hydrolase
MKRREFIGSSVCMGAAGGIANPAVSKAAPGSDQLIERAAAAALAFQRESWEHGILAQALLDAGKQETVILMTKGAICHKTPDGRLAAIGGGATDPAMGALAYWRAGEVTKDPELQAAAKNLIEFLLKRAPRAADGTFYHLLDAPEMWSDSFYTSPPALAGTGHYDEALLQIDGLRKRLWDPKKKLLSHRWDDKTRKFVRQDAWGVGQGWATAGLTRVIMALPASRKPDRDRLIAFERDIIDGCLAHQRPDALFHNVVDRPETFVETNLAQILAFSIYAGLSGGWLPAGYLKAADRMRAAARAKVDQYGLVQGVCGSPEFDHAGVAVEGQAFFIMMEVAGDRYTQRKA